MSDNRSAAAGEQPAELQDALREYIRAKGKEFLKDPNITSVGIGRKNDVGPISLQFTVASKMGSAAEMLAVGSEPIPPKIILPGGLEVPTDVIERSFNPSFQIVAEREVGTRRARHDPIRPGISVGTVSAVPDAGTIGMIVFDRETGAPCILSNWHVLHGNQGGIGADIFQPGSHDDNHTSGNVAGTLLRSHLGDAGDCAVATIRGRGIERSIFGLDVVPRRLARVALDDRLVKSGRTTGVTYGIVRRTDVLAKIGYGAPTGTVAVGGFEIGVDPDRPPADGEISKGGDSGAAWMIADGDAASDIFAGLHFAGEASLNPDEHALACYPQSIQQKLDFMLEPHPPGPRSRGRTAETVQSGYDPVFLGSAIPFPIMAIAVDDDALPFGDGKIIPYTHFSVCMSRARRMARFVAWNIDGAHMVIRPRRGFRIDTRIDAGHQIGNEAYVDNKLDRGHLARRADLCWGTVEEAEQANRESNFYTNIAPQHERYNQSQRKGLWGRLENQVLDQVDVQDVRVSVFAGPLFAEDDLTHRGIRVPASYWKLIAYKGMDGRLRMAAFVLSQRHLLADLETIDLDPFRLFQLTIADLADRTGLRFDGTEAADMLLNPELAAPLLTPETADLGERIRQIHGTADLIL